MRSGLAILLSMVILSGCTSPGNRIEQVTNPNVEPPAASSPETGLGTKLALVPAATPRWRHALPSRHFVYHSGWTDQLLYLDATVGAPYQLHRLTRDGQVVDLYAFPELTKQSDNHVLVRAAAGADGGVAIVNANWELILLDPTGRLVSKAPLDQDYQPIWFDGGRQLLLKSAPLLNTVKVMDPSGAPITTVLAAGDSPAVDPRDLTIAVDPFSPWVLVGSKDQLTLRAKDGKTVWQGGVTRPSSVATLTDRGDIWLLRRPSVSGPSEIQLVGPNGDWTYRVSETEKITGGLVAPTSGRTWLIRQPKDGGASTLTTLNAKGEVTASWNLPYERITLHGVPRDGSWVLLEACNGERNCGQLYVVDATGNVRWHFQDESLVQVSITFDGEGLWLATETEILIFDL